MKKSKPLNILLLEDSPRYLESEGLRLQSWGHHVQYLGEESAVDVSQVDIIIRGMHLNSKWKAWCENVYAKWPTKPILYIGSDKTKKQEAPLVNSRCGFLRYLSSDKALRLKMQSLLRAASQQRRLQQYQTLFSYQRELDRALDWLEPESLMASFMSFLGSKLQTSNILWLVDGDISYYREELWKVKLLNGDEEGDRWGRRSVIWKELSPQQITDLILSIEKGNKAGDSSLLTNDAQKSFRIFDFELKGQHCMVIPLAARNIFFGHMILLDVKATIPKDTFYYWVERLSQSYSRACDYFAAKSLCYIDDVTEFYNQRYLGLALDTEISRGKRNGTPFSVLFLDIDHFKRVNDTQGHLVGSKILTQLSAILRKKIRSVDYGFRYGGDEFVLLLVNTPAEDARIVGERIRKDVESTIFKVDDTELKITLSIGIASYPKHAMTREEIIEMADKAMYHGKHKSRNIVFVAS